ncbi:MurR/RpiR family transcriptional regulator [Vibrio sp. DW001]|uniref:MurR/RpiR family transcriptional regulator n=1 Tax=Vibrio sp. DW001 TaxID=2912315 RepID=UPI0023B1EFA9|nr:MurR/RpiR family transcriptional regulator [Vibrio sp. DW001]WED27005.1 MurR/RpiR family transcriptional regulator [Vibrio sp. DW001]
MSILMKNLESLAQVGNDAEMKIAIQLLLLDTDISEMSAISLGKRCGVSNASIVRFAQSLGYKGYSVFKFDYMALQAQRSNRSLYNDLSRSGSLQNIIKTSSYLLTESLENSVESLTADRIEEVSNLFFNARSIAIFSLGSSSVVASHIMQKFMQLGKSVRFQSDSYLQDCFARQLGEKDVVLVLNANGETEEIVSRVEIAKKSGCKIIAITRGGQSTLNDLSDVTLPFFYSEEHLDVMSSVAQISQMAIFDIVFYRLISLMAEKDSAIDEKRKQTIFELGTI